jgi:hypothetical protein
MAIYFISCTPFKDLYRNIEEAVSKIVIGLLLITLALRSEGAMSGNVESYLVMIFIGVLVIGKAVVTIIRLIGLIREAQLIASTLKKDALSAQTKVSGRSSLIAPGVEPDNKDKLIDKNYVDTLATPEPSN